VSVLLVYELFVSASSTANPMATTSMRFYPLWFLIARTVAVILRRLRIGHTCLTHHSVYLFTWEPPQCIYVYFFIFYLFVLTYSFYVLWN